jgi:translation elongation factor EF-Ts
MWNAVKIDGAWYQMDVTWNDANSANIPYYGYFNITEKEMTEDHSIETKNLSVPPCTATKYSVHEYLALKVTDTAQTAENYQAIVDKIVKGKESHLIITQKYTEVTQSYLKHYVLNAQSTLRQYVNEKGYNFTFELRYRIVGNLIYIPVVFTE